MSGKLLETRRQLDLLFLIDAVASVIFGLLSLLAPHSIIANLSEKGYNHEAHEMLRLYACLRIAVGWIVLHIRGIDDGRFRRSVCEALCFCYILQAGVVIRAQFTDRRTLVNWVGIVVLLALAFCYGLFRFGNSGNLIKIYELPTSTSKSTR